MSFANTDVELPHNFSGIVRLFPLPNLVLLPGVIQALHIFEPRYRKMMDDALAADQLITMALLKPGWETHQGDNPPIHDVVCIGKVMTHSKESDGRYNLLLLGAKRARIVREVVAEQPYRLAEVEVVEDDNSGDEASNQILRQKIVKGFRDLATQQKLIQQESVNNILSDELPVGLLTDLVGFSIGAPTEQLQKVLATPDVQTRGEILLDIIDSQFQLADSADGFSDFPPQFSEN